jgi:hypothetical protein
MQTKRILVFLFGCILTRTIITIIAMKIKPSLLPKYPIASNLALPIMGIIALGIALSFYYLYFFGNERADAQLEWLGDKKIWWNELRIVHGTLFLLFAILAFQQKSYAWIVLAGDTLIGLGAWLIHHKII